MRLLAAAACALLLAAPAGGEGAESPALKEKAREVLARSQGAIVSVKAVVKERYAYQGRDGREEEHKGEIDGTVIDPSGLTAVEDAGLGIGGSFSLQGWDGDQVRYQHELNVVDVKIILGDGSEVPAELVYRDPDLNLAFVRPKAKPKNPWPHVAFSEPAAEPQPLDGAFTIGRLGRDLNRTPVVSVGDVAGVVRKPRTFYVCDLAGCSGCPVFNAKGETIGALIDRGRQVVLPAADVLEAARHALAAKGR